MRSHHLYSTVKLMAVTWGFVVSTSPFAFAISRVGNARIADSSLGFETDIPAPYFEINPLSGSGLRLKAPPVIHFQQSLPTLVGPSIDIIPLLSAYPKLSGVGRSSDVVGYFEGLGHVWAQAATANGCDVAMIAESNSTITAVVSWGTNSGIAMIGTRDGETKRGILALIKNLKIDRGSCVWK